MKTKTAYLAERAKGTPAAPPGYALVPVEPTPEQIAAGQRAWLADPLRRSSTLYRAMVGAAP